MSNLYQNLELDNFPKEEWKDVENYEGIYQVSNLGRVKSLKYDKEKILSQYESKSGYLYVGLCKDNKMKNFRVHRLVANAFIPNPNNYQCVNHKDENKTNNCVDNLEWCDAKYNINYGTCINRRVANTNYKAISRKVAEKLSRQVYQYTKDGTLVAIWESTRECGRNGFDHNHVSDCCLGKRKSHQGYIWSYTELNKKQD